MKVYYVNSQFQGCYYVRCLIPLTYNGWNGDKVSLYGNNYPNNIRTKGVMNSDIIVFHRPDQEEKIQMAKLLKENGKKIVFDNDDTYKGQDKMKFGELARKKSDILDRFITEVADLITCSTEFLAEEYRKITDKPVIVLPNLIDPMDWSEPRKNYSDKIRIGVVGSSAFNQDYLHMKEIFKWISDMPNTQLVLFSLPPKDEKVNPKITALYKPETDFWTSLNIEWQPFVEHKEYNKRLNELELDIMLIPRNDDYFNRCKSNLKFLEASMCEIPVIAQGFDDGKSPYQGIDEDYMLICKNEVEWRNAIKKLIENQKLRRDMGSKAREYVLEEYNAKNKAKLWKKAYKTLYD